MRKTSSILYKSKIKKLGDIDGKETAESLYLKGFQRFYNTLRVPYGSPKAYNPNYIFVTKDWFGFTFILGEMK